MKRPWRWALGLLIALLLVGGLWRVIAARRASQATTPVAGAALPETALQLAATDVVRATRRELAETLPVSGTLRAVDSAVVKARVAGELRGLTVREGDSVTAGQVIARIDTTEYQSRMRQAEEQAGSARSQAEVAQRSYDNNKALVDQGFISKTALDTSLSNLDAARATHRAALAAAEVARKSLDDTVVRSPIAGQVAQRFVQTGERVAVEARVIEVIDLRRIEVEATLAAADSLAVRPGQKAVLSIEGGGADAAGKERRIEATVARVNPSAQAGSRSVLVYLQIAQSEGLRQGLFAQGRIEVGSSSALAVPLSAVRIDKPVPYVQLLVDGRVVHLAVETGRRGEAGGQTLVAITGIDDGALLVAGTVGPLREGTVVRLAPAAP